MKPFPFAKLEMPSTEEMQQAEEIGHEVVAISSLNDEHHMFLKIRCRNGEQTVIWLDAFMVDHLFRHFETTLIGTERTPLPPVRTKFLNTNAISLGTIPQSQA